MYLFLVDLKNDAGWAMSGVRQRLHSGASLPAAPAAALPAPASPAPRRARNDRLDHAARARLHTILSNGL